MGAIELDASKIVIPHVYELIITAIALHQSNEKTEVQSPNLEVSLRKEVLRSCQINVNFP